MKPYHTYFWDLGDHATRKGTCIAVTFRLVLFSGSVVLWGFHFAFELLDIDLSRHFTGVSFEPVE